MTADDIELDDGLVRARTGEGGLVGDITAAAFRNDPFNLWMLGRYPAIRALFRHQAKRIYVPRGFVYRAGTDGACMWALPGTDTLFTRLDYYLFALPTLVYSGPAAIARAVKTGEAMEKSHPTFPHAYLFSIGVRPEKQGTGLGRRLIQPVLDACDRAEMPAYLENSNPANTGFYASCGFEPVGEIRPTPDAPPLVPMLRQPRRS